jgi:hypothetical protein
MAMASIHFRSWQITIGSVEIRVCRLGPIMTSFVILIRELMAEQRPKVQSDSMVSWIPSTS